MVTVSEKDDTQAFKITVNGESHFNIIKYDKRSRVQDKAIEADALLPEGPYNLWRAGETSSRVKDLAGAFAQLPHLPKMLKARPSWTRWPTAAKKVRLSCGSPGRIGLFEPGGCLGLMKTPSTIRLWS